MENQNQKAECCPKFDPASWDGRIFEWENKRFIKDKVLTFFYMPLNFGSAMTRSVGKIEKAGTKMSEGMVLADHTSKWNIDLYLAVDREIPDADNVGMSGKFLSKVYEGEFKDTGKWCKDFATYAKEMNCAIEKQYMWYTTCPKCAKKYGKNYVVIVGKIQ